MLAAYLDRIGLDAPVPATRKGLEQGMRAHLAAIPFENLDVFLGRGSAEGIEAIHAKLIGRRRGGWCYEQNGLLGWALGEMGFEVTPLAARVNKAEGDPGGHLALLVTAEGRELLVDVGFGGSQAAPLPLQAVETRHEPFALTLSERDGWWRYTEDPGGKPFYYEFRAVPADPAQLCHWRTWQQSDPGSPFVGNLVAQRRLGDEHLALRGRVLTVQGQGGVSRRLIADSGELVELLRARFGLDVPEIADKWPAVVARHEELFGNDERAVG
jgi:N-hydroxyarylamine O-acetyltransferase